jgi:cytochrome c-type biogenesis protein CcmH/NrfG
MSWHAWAEALRVNAGQAVADLLRGAAPISPFERAAPHEFLLAVLPHSCRLVQRRLLGEPSTAAPSPDPWADLPALLDAGLAGWLLAQRQAPLPAPRKLGAYAAQVCEALQWPLYFDLPQTRNALQAERARWLPWLGSISLTAYRDPEYDYWQVLAAQQNDNSLQFFWQSFVLEAGRTRSGRYLNLGLLALAKLPLSEEDSQRNLRLQVQALVNRYHRRARWGAPAQQELAEALRNVMGRNLSMGRDNYRAFLKELLLPLGEDKATSVLALLGLAQAQRPVPGRFHATYKLQPPAGKPEADAAVAAVRRSTSLVQAWGAIAPLLTAHEDYLHKSGDPYDFVRALDTCARALCNTFHLQDPEIQTRLFQWIHLALRVDAEDPRRWMLWQLALRQAGQPQRAQWVLWEMTRRFPEQLPCRVELARLLAESGTKDDLAQAQRLLQQVLELDPDHLHAHSTLAQLAIARKDWHAALAHAQAGLRVAPDDEACAVLQATAYARRAEPDDLQTAIDLLKRFVERYPGNLIAEGYLRKLLQRQQLRAQGRHIPLEDEESSVAPSTTPAETDPAWTAFADTIRSWLAAAANRQEPSPEATRSPDRVLPLPRALQQALAQQSWDAEVLSEFDATAQQEFPLETRLWRYLQTVQRQASATEREHAAQALQQWLGAESRNATKEDEGWLAYLRQRWHALEPATETAVATGTAWLQDLLDRYQPLPIPVMA